MKRFAGIFILSVYLLACNNETSVKPAVDSPAIAVVGQPLTAKAVEYPYPATLASDWQIGNPEHVATILKVYKELEQNLVEDSVIGYFADSLTNISFDDHTFNGTSREFLSKVKEFRSGYKSLNEEFISFVPLYSPSANIHQVSIWVKERGIRKNGRPDSTIYQENWRFNEAGKIYFRSAYARYGF